MQARPLQAHTTVNEKRKLILMAVLTVMVFAGIIKTSGVLNQPSDAGDGSHQEILDLPTEPLAPPPAPPAPFPADALAKVADNTVHGEREEPACDLLRTYLLTRSEKELRDRAVVAPTRARMIAEAPTLRVTEAIHEVRGKILSFSDPIPLVDRRSGASIAYRGTIEVDGAPVAFECFGIPQANPHGVQVDEFAVVRGAFYKLASFEDAGGQPQPPLPFFLAAQVEPDYTPYLRRLKDGEDVRRSKHYWYLVRKIKYDPPETRAATLAPRPTDAQLADIGARDELRGKYLEVEGRVVSIQRVELNANDNRAFLDEIWECELDDDQGRRWFFDSITKPSYEEFVRLHRVKVIGAFALLRTWKDDKGDERKGPHLVAIAPELAMAPGDVASRRVPFIPDPTLLARTVDNTPVRDVTYYHLVHQVAALDTAAISAASKKDFTTNDIVDDAKRKAMRGKVVRVSGRLMRVEAFALPTELRLNPSGLTKMYRCYIGTSGRTIYTVEVIEPPGPDLKPMRCEVDVDAAFWQVYEFKSQEQQKEKSPWLVGRAVVLRPPPTPSLGFKVFTFAGAALALGVLLVVVLLSRREAALAQQFKAERRASRRSTDAAHLAAVAPSAPPAPAPDASAASVTDGPLPPDAESPTDEPGGKASS